MNGTTFPTKRGLQREAARLLTLIGSAGPAGLTVYPRSISALEALELAGHVKVEWSPLYARAWRKD